MDKVCYTHKMELNSATERDEMVSCTETWIEPEIIVIRVISQTQKDRTLSYVEFMCGEHKQVWGYEGEKQENITGMNVIKGCCMHQPVMRKLITLCT